MSLSLPQRLFLICYSVDKGKFELTNLQGRGQLLRAAALTKLALDGLLKVEGRRAVRLPGELPDDPFLAEVWRDVPAEKPKGWLSLVHNKAHKAEKPVREQLAATGAVTVRNEKWMGMVAVDRVTVDEPQQVRALQETVRRVVLDKPHPAEASTDELIMAVLAAEVEVTSVLTHKERREHRQTLTALAEHFDTLVPRLRPALRDSYLTSRAAGGGWGN
jgi:hypothetical protein